MPWSSRVWVYLIVGGRAGWQRGFVFHEFEVSQETEEAGLVVVVAHGVCLQSAATRRFK
jgi:hypothetical protein